MSEETRNKAACFAAANCVVTMSKDEASGFIVIGAMGPMVKSRRYPGLFFGVRRGRQATRFKSKAAALGAMRETRGAKKWMAMRVVRLTEDPNAL